jgi:hypothetical protein
MIEGTSTDVIRITITQLTSVSTTRIVEVEHFL